MSKQEFRTQVLDSSQINRLMNYYDAQFLELAYKVVLSRDPDPTGFDHYLQVLRSGESRREILFQIANSGEAIERGVTTEAFGRYLFWRKLQRVPVIGSLLLVILAVFRIKTVVREFRRVQNAAFGALQGYK